MPGPYADHVTAEEKALDRALCNFCNDASDPYEPVAEWSESVQRNLRELGKAYNDWFTAHIMTAEERARNAKWKEACATASYLMARYKDDRNALEGNMADSALMRNIADAIMGTVKAGGVTMLDRLGELEREGKLVRVKPGNISTRGEPAPGDGPCEPETSADTKPSDT